jgi:hypothetical protein
VQRGGTHAEKDRQQPVPQLLCGLVLLVTSGYETWQTISDLSLSAHHGVLVFGIIQILKALPDLMGGAEKLSEAKSAA